MVYTEHFAGVEQDGIVVRVICDSFNIQHLRRFQLFKFKLVCF